MQAIPAKNENLNAFNVLESAALLLNKNLKLIFFNILLSNLYTGKGQKSCNKT